MNSYKLVITILVKYSTLKFFIKYLMSFIKVIPRKIITVIIVKKINLLLQFLLNYGLNCFNLLNEKIPKNIKTFQEHKYLVFKASPYIVVYMYYCIIIYLCILLSNIIITLY